MGLLSFFKRKPAAEFSSAEDVRRARTRARQRLIGSTVLVAVAVIGLPLLLDTAPRPVAVDLPIEVPRKQALAPSVQPPPPMPAASRTITRAELPAEPREEAAAPATAPTPKASVAEPKAPPKPAVAEAKPLPRPASLEAKPASAPVVAAEAANTAQADGRYVVQVGAFAEATGARDARTRVEKLGLKTYTQVVETKDGKRIRVRVGPYAERAEADKAAAQLRASGLAAAVLTL